jgi:hypothetical protein
MNLELVLLIVLAVWLLFFHQTREGYGASGVFDQLATSSPYSRHRSHHGRYSPYYLSGVYGYPGPWNRGYRWTSSLAGY